MPCTHEFGIIEHFSSRIKKYSKYQPEKYNCISIDDDYILPLGEKIYGIKMINPCLNEKCKTLCYYGVTIIPVESLLSLIHI